MWSEPERRFARRWIARVSLGEGLGFALATAAAIAVLLGSLPPVAGLAATVAGGAAEGTVLALAQHAAIRANRPARAPWVIATAGGAAVAWTLGMLPSTLGLDLASPVTWVLIVVGGILLLASIPVAQAIVLRRRGAVRWALVNAGAWAIAILWTAAPSPLVDERTPVPVVAVLYVIAGILMAVTVAVFTVAVAIRLFATPSPLGRRIAAGRAVDGGLGATLHPELRQ